MKNNKGLTLVELLAVLVVLGIIVGIVTQNITKNLKASQVELCYHQIDSLKAAAANWLTDQINDRYDEMFPGGKFLDDVSVTGEVLFEQGYVDKLEDKYKTVKVEISKNDNIYVYEVANSSVYCE